MKISAMIFAAGLGRRLSPLTDTKPKALVSVDGVTLLENAIRKILEAGIDHIVVNIHHFADSILSFLQAHPFDATLEISDERNELLDTAGGLRKARGFFTETDHLLLYNVDIQSSINLGKLIQYHLHRENLATLAVRDRQTSRYFLFDPDTMRLAGWENRSTGERKTPILLDEYKSLAFSGIHVIKKEIIDYIPPGKHSFTPLYVEWARKHVIQGYLHQEDQWMDFGKYEELRKIFGDRIQ